MAGGFVIGELVAPITADSTKFNDALKKAQARGDRAARDIGFKWKRLGSDFKVVGQSLMYHIGIPLAAAGGAALKFSMDMNRGMANVATLIPGSTERVRELKQEVQALAVETAKSTKDMTAGLYQTISAYGDSAETMDRLRISAKAATAGLATVTEAIDLTSAVTKGYGDTSKEAISKASDLALTTVKLGQTTFPELAASIGRVTPLAAELKVSAEELFAVFATATGVTGKAAEVSTQLRGVLQALLAPTEDMTAALQSQGYASGRAMLEQLGLHGAIERIKQSAEAAGLPLQKYISSIEAQTLALALAGAQSTTYGEKLAALRKAAGATDEAFREQTQGVNEAGFTWDQTRTKLEVLAQRMGDRLAPAFNDLLNVIEPTIGKVETLAEWFGRLPGSVRGVVIGMGGLAVAAGPAAYAIGSVTEAAGKMVPALRRISQKQWTVRIGVVMAGAAAGMTLGQFLDDWLNITRTISRLNPQPSEKEQFIKQFQEDPDFYQAVHANITKMRVALKETSEETYVYSGRSQEMAERAYEVVKALTAKKNAAIQAGHATERLTEATESHTTAVTKERELGKALIASLEQENFILQHGAKAWEVRAALLEGLEPAERAELERLLEANTAIQARIDLEELAAEIRAEIMPDIERYRMAQQQLYELEREGLLTHEEVQLALHQMRDQYGLLKNAVDETVFAFEEWELAATAVAQNLEQAFAQWLFDPFEDGLQGMVSAFAVALRRMAADAAAAQIFSLLGSVLGFGGATAATNAGAAAAGTTIAAALPAAAGGGLFVGAGTGTSDSLFARVSNGEFALSASATRSIGVPALEALNARGAAALGGGTSVTVQNIIDARGAAPGVEHRIRTALAEAEGRMVRRAVASVAEMKLRGGRYGEVFRR